MYVATMRVETTMSFSFWVYVFLFVLCTSYAEPITNVARDVEKSVTMRQDTTMQTMVDDEFEEMKNSLKELQNEIRILKLERESREKLDILNEKLQQCESKMMETNTELIKLIKDQRNNNEEYSKCNLFLTNCMTQTLKANEKTQEDSNTQLIISAMDKISKEFQVRHWMAFDKLESFDDLSEALHRTASGIYPHIASVLISLGADVDTRNNEGDTPLMTAVQYMNSQEMVKLLLKNGANINAQNHNGWTALMNATHNAIKHNSTDIMNLLLENGASVNLVNNENLTALMIASEKGRVEFVKILLKHGAITKITDVRGNTALALACKNENIETAMILLDETQNLNIQNEDGVTALMYAALTRDKVLVKKIIDSGADIYVKNRLGKTAIDYAIDNRYIYMDTYIYIVSLKQ